MSEFLSEPMDAVHFMAIQNKNRETIETV